MQARERDVAGTQAASASQGLFRSVATTLAAKSLAIVGASERARWPSEIFRNLREFGYPGRIALVNPRQKAVFGQRCFDWLRLVPELVGNARGSVATDTVAWSFMDCKCSEWEYM